MSFEKKFSVVILAIALLGTIGCSRNKQQAYQPAATAIAPAPAVSAAAPAPVVRRSSTYLK